MFSLTADSNSLGNLLNNASTSYDEIFNDVDVSKYIKNETLTLDLITEKKSTENKVYDRFLDIFIEKLTNNS